MHFSIIKGQALGPGGGLASAPRPDELTTHSPLLPVSSACFNDWKLQIIPYSGKFFERRYGRAVRYCYITVVE